MWRPRQTAYVATRTSTLPAVEAGLISASFVLSGPFLAVFPWTDEPGFWRSHLTGVAWSVLAFTLMTIPIPALFMFATLGQARRVTLADLDSAIGLRVLSLSCVAALPLGAVWAATFVLRTALSPPMHPVGALDLGPMMNGLEGPPRTAEELGAACARLAPELKNWRQVPMAWFDPAPDPPLPVEFTNRIARSSSEYRDRFMMDLIEREVRSGKRVFAVVGASHVVMQEAELRARLLCLCCLSPKL